MFCQCFVNALADLSSKTHHSHSQVGDSKNLSMFQQMYPQKLRCIRNRCILKNSRCILKNSPFSFPSRRFSVSCTTFIKYGIHFKRTANLRNAIIDMLLKAKIRTLKLQTRKQGRLT